MKEIGEKVNYCTDERMCENAQVGTKILVKHESEVRNNPEKETEAYKRLHKEGEIEIGWDGHAQLTDMGWDHYHRVF